MKDVITVAVAGNPNSGKSTLINAIAGTRLHVGNWPGVTIEKHSAKFAYEGVLITLVDLPGIYSLSPYTQEEIIARDYLVHETPDVIINVVDATNLERNLYLTVQLMELEIPMVIALNIHDEAQQKGYTIDIQTMEEMLGVSVVATVATRKTGLNDLLKSVLEAARSPELHYPNHLHYGEDIESAAKALMGQIKGEVRAENYPRRWLAFKLMEGDSRVCEEVNLETSGFSISKAVGHLRKTNDDDIESLIVDARYAQAAGLTHEVLSMEPGAHRLVLTERVDRIVLNRFFGMPIFLMLMYLVFSLTFTLGEPPMG